jgi:hypothetical protein
MARKKKVIMATVLTPMPGQTVVSSDDNDDRRNRGYEHHEHRENFDKREHWIDQQILDNRKAISADNTVIQTNQFAIEGRSLVEAAKNAAAQILESAKNTAALDVQAEKNVAALAVEASKYASAHEVQAEKLAAASLVNSLTLNSATNVLIQTKADAATMFAAQNAAAIAAQVAQCCCAMKETVRDDGDKTRGAIDDLEERINNINDLQNAVALVDAKNEVTLLKTKLPSGTVV